MLQYLIQCLEINIHVGDMIYRLPIDTKSLYLNIKNDNEAGHTATVATPLKQGASYKKDLGQILKIPEKIDPISREKLIEHIMAKSRAEVIIPKICLFKNISVNGEIINTKDYYCIYVREETSSENVHYGRQKVHYPMSLSFSDENICINNKNVIKQISEKLSNYAFLVNAFEYNTETEILNFDITIVGPENIPYSRVFINQRGAGSKYSKSFIESFAETFDNYDTEIVALRNFFGYENVDLYSYSDLISKCRVKAINLVNHHLQKNGFDNVRSISVDYPDSLYDIECQHESKKIFFIVYATSTKNKKVVMSIDKINFLNIFPNNVKIALVTNVFDDARIFIFSSKQYAETKKQIRSISVDYSSTLEDE